MANLNIIQSYLLTVARYDANIYAKRILLQIVKANQHYLEGEKLNGIINIDEDLFKDRYYTFDLKSILLGDEDKNYTRVKKAFADLETRFLRYDDDDVYFSIPFIMGVKIEKNSGVARFRMSELVYKAFADYSKGFRKFEFQLTMSFNSVYSIRMYELMSGQKNPLTYTIDSLKKMFGLEKKYKRPTDFIKRVIDPAQVELNEKSPYTFSYEINKKGRMFNSITFTPIFQPEHASEEAERHELSKRVGSSAYLTREERIYLKESFDMSPQQIKNNHDTFFQSKKKHGDYFIHFLDKLRLRANDSKVRSKQAYLVGSLQKDLENK